MRLLFKIIAIFFLVLLLGTVALAGYVVYQVESFDTETPPARHGQVDQRLFLGPGERQPLIVGFGGGEGGNAWASDHWKAQRQRFLDQGYAFLAIGYFGGPKTPKELDRIALDAVHAAIVQAAADPRIESRCIALIGGSKGAELALALGSRYPDVDAVVGIVPASVVFAAHTPVMTTSSWTDRGAPLPFVPVPWSATLPLLSGDLRAAFEIMMADQTAWNLAQIPAENLRGPLLLVSATEDEMWPSQAMAEQIMQRLDAHGFAYTAQHLAIEGGHGEPLKHFDKMEAFLATEFQQPCLSNSAAQLGEAEVAAGY
ncbi:acyl-CoA thioester hydrolase/BAAT C-terminal domain-containing protein [Pseudomarimonas arenosa]|uniref:BAAT/Acyl-CoA thioester hydrolase C-terminal domain-containing protein n=1 Tax=Pseudomarimonas arenosa TaxID=2774145 RepID=A0AAW3ZK82_9GAMM|nr:acyl-CoA thioester hydrolase/BAAT C-terminal domain-containing protein [Pseudomarimonas arenosa]MBD8526411.1 hypothetical protein [Pseudomarimonas arenosa]